MVAEFWEDGGGSSFPPGTWMTFGQFTSARDNHTIDDDAMKSKNDRSLDRFVAAFCWWQLRFGLAFPICKYIQSILTNRANTFNTNQMTIKVS